MKKFLITGLSVLFVALALFSCGSDEPKDKPSPDKTMEPVEVLLNGVVIKNGAEVSSKALELPEVEGTPSLFKNILGFKATKSEQLGKYSFYVKKVGDDKVAGFFKQICLVGSSCYPVDNNSYSAYLDVKELNKEIQYELDYAIKEVPTKEVEAKLLVELKCEKGNLLHSFTIKMTYKP